MGLKGPSRGDSERIMKFQDDEVKPYSAKNDDESELKFLTYSDFESHMNFELLRGDTRPQWKKAERAEQAETTGDPRAQLEQRIRDVNISLSLNGLPKMSELAHFLGEQKPSEDKSFAILESVCDSVEALLRSANKKSKVSDRTEEEIAKLRSRIKMLERKLEAAEESLAKELKKTQTFENRNRELESKLKEKIIASNVAKKHEKKGTFSSEQYEKELARKDLQIAKLQDVAAKVKEPQFDLPAPINQFFYIQEKTIPSIQNKFLEIAAAQKGHLRRVCNEVESLKSFIVAVFGMIAQKKQFFKDLRVKEKVMASSPFQEVALELFNIFRDIV